MANRKPVNRRNSQKTLGRLREVWRLACVWIKSLSSEKIDDLHVCISKGNHKIGNCLNVSIMPVVTCGKMGKLCCVICYAVRCFCQMGIKGNKWKKNKWLINTLLAVFYPEKYFGEIKSAISDGVSRKRNPIKFFRWHVGGEILSLGYFKWMCFIAEEFPNVRFLAFTKRYELVNEYMDKNGGRNCIPENLSVIYSAAPGQSVPNPYHLPECHIFMADETLNKVWRVEFVESKIYNCPSNCETCQCNGAGCWFIKDGCIILIIQH